MTIVLDNRKKIPHKRKTPINAWGPNKFPIVSKLPDKVPKHNDSFSIYGKRTTSRKTVINDWISTNALMQFVTNIENPLPIFTFTTYTNDLNTNDFCSYESAAFEPTPYVDPNDDDKEYTHKMTNELIRNMEFDSEYDEPHVRLPGYTDMDMDIDNPAINFSTHHNVKQGDKFTFNNKININDTENPPLVIILLSSIHTTFCVLYLSKIYTIGFAYNSVENSFNTRSGVLYSADLLTPTNNVQSRIIWIDYLNNDMVKRIEENIKKTTQIEFRGIFIDIINDKKILSSVADYTTQMEDEDEDEDEESETIINTNNFQENSNNENKYIYYFSNSCTLFSKDFKYYKKTYKNKWIDWIASNTIYANTNNCLNFAKKSVIGYKGCELYDRSMYKNVTEFDWNELVTLLRDPKYTNKESAVRKTFNDKLIEIQSRLNFLKGGKSRIKKYTINKKHKMCKRTKKYQL